MHQIKSLPKDVDYRVMITFLEFYETLLGFVLFRLYSTIGLHYPPVTDPVSGSYPYPSTSETKSVLSSCWNNNNNNNIPTKQEGVDEIDTDGTYTEENTAAKLEESQNGNGTVGTATTNSHDNNQYGLLFKNLHFWASREVCYVSKVRS